MSVRGAVFLGIGAMVGSGIFALLGESAVVAGFGMSPALAGLIRTPPSGIRPATGPTGSEA